MAQRICVTGAAVAGHPAFIIAAADTVVPQGSRPFHDRGPKWAVFGQNDP